MPSNRFQRAPRSIALAAHTAAWQVLDTLEPRYFLSVPNGPFGLATPVASATGVTVTWHDNATNETGFAVERKSGGAAFAQVGTVGANVTSFNDASVSGGTAYTYRVKAFNAQGDSGYAVAIDVTTPGVPSPMPTPTPTGTASAVPNGPFALGAAAKSSSEIDLNWHDNSDNESGFAVERKSGGGAYAVVATLPANTTVYDDLGLSASTQYTYRVRAFNNKGDSSFAGETPATTLAGTTPTPTTPTTPTPTTPTTPTPTTPGPTPTSVPNGPFALGAKIASSSEIDLNWQDNSNNESGFAVERQSGAGGFAVVATLAANTTQYSDVGLPASSSFTYRVRAFNAKGDSSFAGPLPAATPSASTGSPNPTPTPTPTTPTPTPTTPTPTPTTPTPTATGGVIDPSTFFPIGVFYQPTYTFDTWQARGVNTMYGYEPYNATSAAWSYVAQQHGFHYIREPDNAAVDKTDPWLLAYVNPTDEPDIRGPNAIITAQQAYAADKAMDPTRPVMNTYSGGYVDGWQSGGPTDAEYQTLFANTDWASAVFYPVTGWNRPDAIDMVGKTVDRMKQLAPGKREFAYIETGNQHLPWAGPDERGPTADEFRGEVWDSVIHGATGIIYFPDALQPFSYDNTDPNVAVEMKIQNAKLTQYGGALLSAENPAGVSMSGSGTVETGWRKYNGKTYFFSMNLSPTAATATMSTTGLASSQTLSVDGEGRTVTLQNGQLTDSFKPFELHVYVV